jgi:hypothetical protein
MTINWKNIARIFYRRVKIYTNIYQAELENLEKLLEASLKMHRCEICNKRWATCIIKNMYYNYLICDDCIGNDYYSDSDKKDFTIEDLSYVKDARNINIIVSSRGDYNER